MSYTNAIGQTIEVGDVVTHTTASQYASLSMGFVRGFHEEPGYGTHPPIKVDVTWVFGGHWGLRHGDGAVHTSVRLPTVTKIDPVSLSPQLQERLAATK